MTWRLAQRARRIKEGGSRRHENSWTAPESNSASRRTPRRFDARFLTPTLDDIFGPAGTRSARHERDTRSLNQELAQLLIQRIRLELVTQRRQAAVEHQRAKADADFERRRKSRVERQAAVAGWLSIIARGVRVAALAGAVAVGFVWALSRGGPPLWIVRLLA